MDVITVNDVEYNDDKPSIFLAGPCPRHGEHDWREDAIKLLEEQGFDGHVYNPTNPKYEQLGENAYEIQCNWEREHLRKATVILFWVDRSEEHPAFTTNVEFGYWLATRPDAIIYGRPDTATQIKYLDWLYATHNVELLKNINYVSKEFISKCISHTLEDVTKYAIRCANWRVV